MKRGEEGAAIVSIAIYHQLSLPTLPKWCIISWSNSCEVGR